MTDNIRLPDEMGHALRARRLALGLALRLERAGLPTAEEVARRFQMDDDDAP